METQNQRKISSSGHEGHGVHVCHKCGWPFPNPHPSAKHRRAHKRICGTIEGYWLDDSGDNKTHLDAYDDEHLSDDDSKTPSNDLKTVEKMVWSGSGPGNRSSRSTRSDEEVFSDAVTDFADLPGATGCVDVAREPANEIRNISKDDATQVDVEKAIADAGDLYPPNSTYGTQPHTVECLQAENERMEIDMPPQHHLSSSTLDSIPNSGFDARGEEISVSKNMLPCSEIAVVLDSGEKGSIDAVLDKKSGEITTIPNENAAKSLESVFVPQKMMKVIEKQSDGFDAKDDCSTEVDLDGKINNSENLSQATEDANREAGSPLELFEGHGSCNDSIHNLVVPGDLCLREHSEVMLEEYKDQKTEKLPAAVTPDTAQEVECVEHGEGYVTEDTFSGISLVEPDDDPNKISDYIRSEALGLEHKSAEELSVEKKSEKTEIHATDDDICSTTGVVACPDKNGNEVGQGKTVTSPEEQNTLALIHTNLQSVLDDGDSLTHSTKVVKNAQEYSEHDNKDTQICNALQLEADSSKVAKEVLPLTSETLSMADNNVTPEKKLVRGGDGRDFDVMGGDVDKLSESTLIVPLSDDRMDDKVEVERKLVGESPAAPSESKDGILLKHTIEKNLQDSEAAVKDSRSREQIVSGKCTSAVGISAISSIGDNAEMSEQAHNDKDCANKALDSADVSPFNNLMDEDARLDKNGVSEGVKELENLREKMSGQECIGKVDLHHISDNNDSNKSMENRAKGIDEGAYREVHFTKEREGTNYGFTDGDMNLVKQKETISALDIEADSHTAKGEDAGGHGEDHFTRERGGINSGFTDGDTNLVKQEETVSALDIQADSSSQTDSLEGNWGSISVLSALSDAPAATDTGSQPSQASVNLEKASLQPRYNDEKSYVFKQSSFTTSVEQKADGSGQNEGAPEGQILQKPREQAGSFPSVIPAANDFSGRKKNDEMSTGKQHMPLKSFLGESLSPNSKDNPPRRSRETENIMMDTKEPANKDAKQERGEEWNSPARYPANIKREKGKVKSRPYWVPFICCSSVQTS